MISIAVDFDGTLCEDKFPEIGEAKCDNIELIKDLRENGVKIVLWTCRTGIWLSDAVNWCKERGLEFDSVNENLPEVQERWKGDTRKVMVTYHFDDKNLGGIEVERENLKRLLEKIKEGE